MNIEKNIEKNIEQYKKSFSNCADIKMIDMYLGAEKKCHCFIAYIEVVLENTAFEKNMQWEYLTSHT